MIYDYHLHTAHSEDSDAPMADMIQSAIEKGLDEIAITDHHDPFYRDPNYRFFLQSKPYHKELEKQQKQYKDKIVIRAGLEIGIQKSHLESSRRAVQRYPYDFIIGSFHCAGQVAIDLPEFYKKFPQPGEAYRTYYLDMLACLKEYRDYDVVGHFNLIDRYAPIQDPPSMYSDLIETILRQIVEDEKGLEINTSCFRIPMGGLTTPTPEILSRYVTLGGRIITIGSDAHRPEDVGAGFNQAIKMVRAAGLDRIAAFSQRTPIFHMI